MSVAADDNTIVVGAPSHATGGERAGATYVFERRDGRWLRVAKLVRTVR